MSFKSLGNPFDGNSDLTHGPGCSCPICVFARQEAQSEYECSETELTEKLLIIESGAMICCDVPEVATSDKRVIESYIGDAYVER